MHKRAKTILGIIAAGAVGAAIGMILARERGRDMRSSEKGRLAGIEETLADMITAGSKQARKSVSDLKNKSQLIKEDLKTTIEHSKKILS